MATQYRATIGICSSTTRIEQCTVGDGDILGKGAVSDARRSVDFMTLKYFQIKAVREI